ncbi:DUF6443 domain-containing protein [Chryseobacterium arthrosphaerae]|uniref:DUF6443 domain-containing protein n=1 Tax=Chryseobacterium arthrosphaerae TaxID=651561 RepID=UPI001BAF02E1|nr:DUF6443 domain-containing protein [Chryseobacterium arthrosphaerae]QUY57847.1 RHS repeat-associated core domain-containing protein [Chryseobacterium arthrosphaerae]
MKKILIPIGILVMGTVKSQLTPLPSTENYIQAKTYLDYNGTQATKAAETVQYFDGLGRPKQMINVKASPLGRDVVTPVVYDQFGRQTRDYLPIPQSGTQNGTIYPQTSGMVNFPVSDAAGMYTGEKIYSEKVLENSPLDRIQQQIQVGNDWGAKPVKFEYAAVTVADGVRKFTTLTSWENGATKSVLGENWLYTDNQLYKNTVIDEDGNKTLEFKNGKGQTLMVRKEDGSSTYYVYNEYDQLAFVLPPMASMRGDIVSNTTKHDELCYQYRYDGRGRLVEKKLPGKGWESMVYDKQDRLVATQDAELKAKGQWLYTKYDQYGRVAITGLSTGGERITEQTLADLQGSNNVMRISTVLFNRQSMDVYYDNPDTTYPNSSKWVTLLSLNYYDSYPGYDFNPAFPTNTPEMTVLTATPTSDGRSTKGLPVMSFVKNIEDDNWTRNYTYYNLKGRVIATHSINHLVGYTRTETKLDFAGLPQQTVTRHKRLDTDAERIITETFEYDHQNRLLVHKHQVDNNPVEYLTQNKYNELSQLESRKVGGIDVTSPLQQIDYRYNIRGWMTKINDPKNLNGKLFGYEIKYNLTEGLEIPNVDFPELKVKPKFNGNIAEIDWKTSTDPNDYLRRYGYVYDALNRLSAGFYQKNNNPSGKEYFEKMDYDANGNITQLKRSAASEQGVSALIDNLTYAYEGNRLKTVTDSSTDYRGYPDTSGSIIGYDDNGNMTDQKDKGILNITYNYLNLPDYILFNRFLSTRTGQLRENTQYLYRADGIKLRKTYKYAPSNPLGTETSLYTKTTEYLDGFQYETGTGKKELIFGLKFVPTPEGYYNFENNKYIYNYTDHLGNVRLSYFKNGTGIEVLEENNYYPFGLKHEGYNTLPGNPNYNYKYNEKELQAESGMYDYGARFYMPELGRWGVLDNYSENYTSVSPYNYVANNPIKYIDINGDWIYINDQNGTQYRYHNGATQHQVDGKWTNVDANTKLSDYVIQTVAGLNHLNKNTSIGNTMIGYFDQAQGKDGKVRDIYFNYTSGDSQIRYGISNIIDLNTSLSSKGVWTTLGNDSEYSPIYTTIAHEMGHVYENYALGVTSQVDNRFGKDRTTAEIYGTHVENIVRAESGLPLRTHYGSIIDGVGKEFPAGAGRLMDSVGRSIYFNSEGNQISPTPSLLDVRSVNKTILQNRYNYHINGALYNLRKIKNYPR